MQHQTTPTHRPDTTTQLDTTTQKATDMTATLIARYTVQPGKASVVESALREMADRVKADEPACLIYNANVSVDDENLYCLYEVYENEDALVAHRETPHFKQYIEGVVVPVLEKREREVYRQVIG